MKRKTMGIIMFVFVGGMMLTWATFASSPPPDVSTMVVNATGTLADLYPPENRVQFCGTGHDAKFTRYITEYKVPTFCSQPHAIVAGDDGLIWFAQDTTARVASFDPATERFVEYNNTFWPQRFVTAIWGMDYSPDNSLWFSDSETSSVWRFDIDEQEYGRIQVPLSGESFLQWLRLDGSRIVANDLQGGSLVFFEASFDNEQMEFYSIPSPKRGHALAGFDIADDVVWFSTWRPNEGGSLVRFAIDSYLDAASMSDDRQPPIGAYMDQISFPDGLETPNGLAVSDDGTVWLADTSSSGFFSFDPFTASFTHYLTSPPHPASYGNWSGLFTETTSRPYWIDFADDGRLVFNEHNANRIAVMNVTSGDIIEYHVPSANYEWADCQEGDHQCGTAQVFGFVPVGDKIWFTEWAANNIGVVDTSVPPEVTITVDEELVALEAGQTGRINMTVSPQGASGFAAFVTSDSAPFADIEVSASFEQIPMSSEVTVPITIETAGSAPEDIHKVLVGVQLPDVTVSKYITVVILPSESEFIGPT